MNAGVLWLTGGNLFWLRVPMFLLFLAYLPCVYLIARASRPPPSRRWRRCLPSMGASGLPGRYAVVVRAYLAVIGAYFLVGITRRGAGAGCCGGPRRRAFPLLLDHRLWYCWRWRCTSLPALKDNPTRANEACDPASVFLAVPLRCALARGGRARRAARVPRSCQPLLPVAAICGLEVWQEVRAGPDRSRHARAPCGARRFRSWRACRSLSCSSPRRTWPPVRSMTCTPGVRLPTREDRVGLLRRPPERRPSCSRFPRFSSCMP